MIHRHCCPPHYLCRLRYVTLVVWTWRLVGLLSNIDRYWCTTTDRQTDSSSLSLLSSTSSDKAISVFVWQEAYRSAVSICWFVVSQWLVLFIHARLIHCLFVGVHSTTFTTSVYSKSHLWVATIHMFCSFIVNLSCADVAKRWIESCLVLLLLLLLQWCVRVLYVVVDIVI